MLRNHSEGNGHGINSWESKAGSVDSRASVCPDLCMDRGHVPWHGLAGGHALEPCTDPPLGKMPMKSHFLHFSSTAFSALSGSFLVTPGSVPREFGRIPCESVPGEGAWAPGQGASVPGQDAWAPR